MPSLGADMEAGTLIEWVKHPGDVIAHGDIIAVVDTDKGAIEIEAFEDGVLETTVIAPGQLVPVGTVMAMIRPTGPGQPAVTPPAEPAAAAAPLASEPAPAARPARLRVSPVARGLAATLGVDLTTIAGTGLQGAITREDVERAAAAAARPGAAAPDRLAAMRTAIAATMSRSKRDIPHYYLSTTIDMSTAVTWLQAENAKRAVPERLLPAVLLIKAVALALGEVPQLNGHWLEGRFQPGNGVHVGVAISLRGGGLVAPALHHVDRTGVTELMHRLQDLVARARAGSLRSSELSDATITVTNLGDQGVEAAFGIIYPPQVALIGFGKIAERPWASAGSLGVRPVVTATLSGDHRATDGHRGGVFLRALDRRLQSPESL